MFHPQDSKISTTLTEFCLIFGLKENFPLAIRDVENFATLIYILKDHIHAKKNSGI